MAQVICRLPNASEEISGVKFEPIEGGMISEEISDEQAELFVSINGYELVGEKKPAPAADADLAELQAKAAALGIPAKGNWGAARLKAEIERAEKKAADAAAAGEETKTGTEENGAAA